MEYHAHYGNYTRAESQLVEGKANKLGVMQSYPLRKQDAFQLFLGDCWHAPLIFKEVRSQYVSTEQPPPPNLCPCHDLQHPRGVDPAHKYDHQQRWDGDQVARVQKRIWDRQKSHPEAVVHQEEEAEKNIHRLGLAMFMFTGDSDLLFPP